MQESLSTVRKKTEPTLEQYKKNEYSTVKNWKLTFSLLDASHYIFGTKFEEVHCWSCANEILGEISF